ncbi:RNA-binding NOB1-like protein [Beta vulgaris subsp. vulgaris]|uniref:RNA-binding NOB1-like protein n=1 Tax=Beta vulgaris subsp. vulgaris TaxID=3555 RepID=UPI0020371C91|nr:RNA-binding NOB1-like protein [Beta vulgaris subsp. vulgaris]
MESQAQEPVSCWSNIVKKIPDKPPPQSQPSTTLFESCNSTTKPISLAVVDAGVIIHGGERISSLADKFVSVSDVINEIRDPTSRHRLSVLPFSIQTSEPSSDALKKVVSFARATGDLQTLSDVDLKLIALTYTLEAQIHGTSHLRDIPPPIHVLNVRRLPEKELPGWGSNVPNLEEWEALESVPDSGPDPNSRILPLMDLTLNIPVEDQLSLQDGSVENGAEGNDGAKLTSRRHRRYPPKKREVKIEGKMVADGIDASQGQDDDDNVGDWRPAVSRSTHRRFLRRKARRETYEASLKDDEQQNDVNTEGGVIMEAECNVQTSDDRLVDQGVSEVKKDIDRENAAGEISSILEQIRLEEDALNHKEQDEKTDSHPEVASIDAHCENAHSGGEGDNDAALDHLENGSVDTSYAEDDGSEQSWMLRSLSDSSVACITGDFAMQNVILQMGLRLVAPGGMQIRELHRWVLKCHACQNVTAEVGRLFCPKCGNGGTLRKVAVTVGENGVVLQARRHRISLRGTKFSLPLPQGGRDAISKNPVLREDQLPQKFLYPKTKKKSNKDDDFCAVDSIFLSHHAEKKASHRPPVRQALAVFSGKRNPNDNHYSRAKH